MTAVQWGIRGYKAVYISYVKLFLGKYYKKKEVSYMRTCKYIVEVASVERAIARNCTGQFGKSTISIEAKEDSNPSNKLSRRIEEQR